MPEPNSGGCNRWTSAIVVAGLDPRVYARGKFRPSSNLMKTRATPCYLDGPVKPGRDSACFTRWAPQRRPRVCVAPYKSLFQPQKWIPAFAGMTLWIAGKWKRFAVAEKKAGITGPFFCSCFVRQGYCMRLKRFQLTVTLAPTFARL